MQNAQEYSGEYNQNIQNGFVHMSSGVTASRPSLKHDSTTLSWIWNPGRTYRSDE